LRKRIRILPKTSSNAVSTGGKKVETSRGWLRADFLLVILVTGFLGLSIFFFKAALVRIGCCPELALGQRRPGSALVLSSTSAISLCTELSGGWLTTAQNGANHSELNQQGTEKEAADKALRDQSASCASHGGKCVNANAIEDRIGAHFDRFPAAVSPINWLILKGILVDLIGIEPMTSSKTWRQE
jgi:hypothetical protein